ncbi:MAG: hypothetical protein FWG32_03370 [Oscillospiraceae bacterium]|nr:hypothetical protein [Oscillospiraceae bacterium]
MKTLATRILHPNTLLIFLLAPLSAAALIFTFTAGRENTVIGYISYALSAYATAVLTINIPEVSARARALVRSSRIWSLIYGNKYGNRFITDLPYRAIVSLYMSLFMNTLYAAFKLIAGIRYASFWYGADAVFYSVLSAAQFLMLRHVRKKETDLENEYRQYRFCGFLLFALNTAFTGVVFQIVRQNMGYRYPGLMIYIVASYAFICMAVAVVNVIKYRKLNSPVLSAVKAIRLAKASVAMYSLQTAMLISFGGEESEAFKNLMNGLTGVGVCLFICGLAVFMIIRANNNLKKHRH